MTTTPKILAFSGSLRQDSFNHTLVSHAAKHADSLGAVVRVIRLRDYPMPIYDGDIEAERWPENLEPLKDHFRWADGFLISAPEYNSSISASLKNAIDWVSRPNVESEPNLVAFKGKTAGLLAASPGGLGGLRGLVHVRSILQNIGTTVVPSQFALAQAHNAFDDAGNLKDENHTKAANAVVEQLVETTRKLIA